MRALGWEGCRAQAHPSSPGQLEKNVSSHRYHSSSACTGMTAHQQSSWGYSAALVKAGDQGTKQAGLVVSCWLLSPEDV